MKKQIIYEKKNNYIKRLLIYIDFIFKFNKALYYFENYLLFNHKIVLYNYIILI